MPLFCPKLSCFWYVAFQPIKNPPTGKKYVRCPCNCLLICKDTSRRIGCPRPNWYVAGSQIQSVLPSFFPPLLMKKTNFPKPFFIGLCLKKLLKSCLARPSLCSSNSRRIINLSPVMVIPEEQPAQPALPIQPEGMRVVCGHCGNTFLVCNPTEMTNVTNHRVAHAEFCCYAVVGACILVILRAKPQAVSQYLVMEVVAFLQHHSTVKQLFWVI